MVLPTRSRVGLASSVGSPSQTETAVGLFFSPRVKKVGDAPFFVKVRVGFNFLGCYDFPKCNINFKPHQID